LYEIDGPRYRNPDATARFDSIQLHAEGPDRVRVSGVRGEPPPPDTKVCLNYMGGYRNSVTFLLAGLEVEEKARLAQESLWKALGGTEQFREVTTRIKRRDCSDPATNEEAIAELTVTVKDPDPRKVGRAFSNRAVELTLSSYPGFTLSGPPSAESSYAVYWPTLVPNECVEQAVVFEGARHVIPPVTLPVRAPVAAARPVASSAGPDAPAAGTWGASRQLPLGSLFGARSGDKGGNANVGVWARDARAYAWLASFLTEERLRELIPEARDLPVERFEFANLLALNFVIAGLLGEGVASSTRTDPQAKTLGEYLRAKLVPIPVELIEAREGSQ
jgi:hypothetical protein